VHNFFQSFKQNKYLCSGIEPFLRLQTTTMVKQKLDKPPRTIRKKRKPKVLPLFQAHDKFFKIVFQDKENASDFLKTYFMPQFPDISLDLDTLHLDDAQHVSSKLHPLFSALSIERRHNLRTLCSIWRVCPNHRFNCCKNTMRCVACCLR
jgi:Putative transposase, YhgA-like